MRSIKTILISYLAIALLATVVLTIAFFLFLYHPNLHKTSGDVGFGIIFLDCSLWGLLFAVAGSSSLINVISEIRVHFILSFFSFVLGPALLLLMGFLLLKDVKDLFGFIQTGGIFIVLHISFFFRFRFILNQRSKLI